MTSQYDDGCRDARQEARKYGLPQACHNTRDLERCIAAGRDEYMRGVTDTLLALVQVTA